MKNIFEKTPPDNFGQHHAEKVLEVIGRNEGEEPLNAVRHHWIEMARAAIPPFLVALLFAALAIFNLTGGAVLVIDQGYAGQFDGLNQFIVVALVVLGAALLWPRKAGAKKGITYGVLLTLAVGLLVVFALRYFGARFFVFEPVAAQASASVIGPITLGLLIIALLAFAYAVYEFFEWQDDFLILTNHRVITYHQELFGQHRQNQMGIEDVQNVQGKTKSYPEHLLGFGTLTITSATLNRNITFKNANLPWHMQKKISGAANASKSAKSAEDLQRLIEEKVFNNPLPPKPKPKKVKVDSHRKPLFMRWKEQIQKPQPKRQRFESNVPGILRAIGVPDNPQVEPADWQEKGTLPTSITWRRHWVFFALGMMKPLAILLVGMPLTIGAYLLGALSAVMMAFLILAVLLVFAGLYAWEFEDYVNDPYILNQSSLIDVEKKPFGPEDRVTAGLDKIQNVSLNTTFVSRLFNFGDVLMTTAGADKPLTFFGIPYPTEVVGVINEFLADFRRREKERSFKDSVELLKQYHKVSVAHQEQERANGHSTQASATSG